jgi:hypothetical protein
MAALKEQIPLEKIQVLGPGPSEAELKKILA